MEIPLLIPSDLATLYACVALLLAAIAGFITLVHRKGSPMLPHPSFQCHYDSCSSSSDDDDDEEEDDEVDNDLSSCSEDPEEASMPFFWPEIGGAVVKACDGLGLRSSSSSISLFDLSRGEILKSFAAATTSFNFVSQTVVLSVDQETSAVKLWDARGSGDSPAATGGYLGRRAVAVAAGSCEGRVYVRDDAGEVAEVDLRGEGESLQAPARWWDAGHGKTLVAVEDGRCGSRAGASVASWCRNAAKCFDSSILA